MQNLSSRPLPERGSSTSSTFHTGQHQNALEPLEHMDSPEEMDFDVYEMSDTKRSKKEPGGKKIRSCIYCRRSHMVCDAERPCRRCKKRGITDLCLEDSRLAARQMADRAARAALKRGNTESGASIESSGSGSGTGGMTGHKKRRTSSNAGLVGERPVEGNGSTSSWGQGQAFTSMPNNTANMDGFYPGNTAVPSQAQAGPSTWSFGTNLELDNGNSNNTMDGNNSGFIGNASDMSNIWPVSGRMNMGMVNPPGSNGNLPFTTGLYPAAGPISSSSNYQGSGEQDRSVEQTKYLNVALNNVPRRASAERGGEFGILSEYLESLGIPSLPGGLGDVFTETTQTINPHSLSGPTTQAGPSVSNRNDTVLSSEQPEDSRMASGDPIGNALTGLEDLEDYGFDWSALGSPMMGLFNVEANPRRAPVDTAEDVKPLIPEASSTEKFYLTAADQQSGTRDERLKKVIQAKYEAGLLKPYDYARGYARMYKWLEKNVSQSSIQAILRPMSVFRPAFRAIAQSLSDLDLIFVEEAFERLMLDYDRVFSAIHTPACLWRRTGEIYKGNKEMSNLTGIPSQCFRGGNLGIFQLMDEESIVKYYQLFGSIAFDINTKSVNTVCTLHIPAHLTQTSKGDHTVTHTPALASPVLGPAPTHPFNSTSSFTSPTSSPHNALGGNRSRLPNSLIPTLSLGQPSTAMEAAYGTKIIKCALNFTIRRDSWGMPIAIIGNWIPY